MQSKFNQLKTNKKDCIVVRLATQLAGKLLNTTERIIYICNIWRFAVRQKSEQYDVNGTMQIIG